MLKLQQLKAKQQQQQQAPATTEQTPSTETKPEESSGTGYVLKRQNSKELAEARRQKSKESNSVFTLKSASKGKGGGKKGKKNAAELVYFSSLYTRSVHLLTLFLESTQRCVGNGPNTRNKSRVSRRR